MESKRNYERSAGTSLVIVINDSIFRVINWSYGGFLIDGARHKFLVGALLTIAGIGEKADDHPTSIVTVNIPARVVRHDEGTHIAISCLQLDDSALEVLQQHDQELH